MRCLERTTVFTYQLTYGGQCMHALKLSFSLNFPTLLSVCHPVNEMMEFTEMTNEQISEAEDVKSLAAASASAIAMLESQLEKVEAEMEREKMEGETGATSSRLKKTHKKSNSDGSDKPAAISILGHDII